MRTVVIATARLCLCATQPSDLPVLHERVLSKPEVMRQVLAGQALSAADAQAFFGQQFDRVGTGTRLGVLVERASNEVVGFAGLMACDALGAADFEIGFVLAQPFWGRGYAQEIGRAQLEFGFSTLRCARLLGQVSPQNPASIKALERLGMRWHSSIEAAGRGPRHVYMASAP